LGIDFGEESSFIPDEEWTAKYRLGAASRWLALSGEILSFLASPRPRLVICCRMGYTKRIDCFQQVYLKG
ncbi:MAG: hypothetical protein IKW80_05865, partial [Thermoguttaceae bacterium]|nr:hypothetical protein [Thermoguttaceae bacterium]